MRTDTEELVQPEDDATHDPATFYRVYRSNSHNAEFIEIGASTTTYHVDSGSAGELSCYYVEAENGGGPEQ